MIEFMNEWTQFSLCEKSITLIEASVTKMGGTVYVEFKLIGFGISLSW